MIIYGQSKFKRGFTFIEILVSATIVSLLIGISSISYTNVVKDSRDAKRRADLEELRAALELYRSNNAVYPLTLSALTASPVYIQKVPVDPYATRGYSYQYQPLPAGCNNTATNCTDYTLAARLENDTGSCSASPGSCLSSSSCNYCTGPYGVKDTAVIPTSPVVASPTPPPGPTSTPGPAGACGPSYCLTTYGQPNGACTSSAGCSALGGIADTTRASCSAPAVCCCFNASFPTSTPMPGPTNTPGPARTCDSAYCTATYGSSNARCYPSSTCSAISGSNNAGSGFDNCTGSQICCCF